MNIPFSPPDITKLEIDAVTQALNSGWITTGPRTKKLENLIADYVGTKRCVCLNSQTACAEMALRVIGVKEGDEVIVPAYTYTATVSVVCHLGATPIMIDCDTNSFEMDYDAVAAAITKRTKAIIPVDLAGLPCNYDKLFDIVKAKKELFVPTNKIQKQLGRVFIMADTAHSFGAELDGTKTGNIADFSSFSFHAVKNLTTAEGGALTWKSIEGVDDDEIYKQLQLLSLHGQSKDALSKTQIGSWEYDIIGTWYKCNMTDIAAAIGLAQFERYDSLLSRRKQIIEMYDKAFKPLGIEVLTHYCKHHSSSGHLYLTRIPEISVETRNKIIREMAERGISCNVHYKPLPMHTAYKKLGFDISNYPNAYEHYKNEITLPLHTRLSDTEVEYVIDNYKEIVGKYI